MTIAETDHTLELLDDVASSLATPNPDRVRALRDAGGAVDREMWSQIADAGWLSIMVPEDRGGAGLGLEAAAIVARRLGYAGFPEPFVAAGVLAPLVLVATEEDEELAAVIAGERLVGVGWQLEVETVSGGATLNGRSRYIPVPGADAYVVAARGAGGVGLHLVPADAGGLTVTEEHRADGGVSVLLSLDGVDAPAVVEPDRGAEVLDAALDVARIAVAAELVGLGERVLEMTLEYLRGRTQFGKPIGAFQALQHRAVDAWMELQLASAALEAAVAAHADPGATPRDRAVAASSAKARASAAIPELCSTALQLHGAIGFTDEHELGLYLNRSLALAPWLGNSAWHRRRYAELAGDPEGVR